MYGLMILDRYRDSIIGKEEKNMDGNVGYNQGKIEELQEKVSTVSGQVGSIVAEQLEDKVVNRMATVWYAPQAVEFFANFKTTVKQLGTSLTEMFNAYCNVLTEAGNVWAEYTGGNKVTAKKVADINIDIKVDVIKAADDANNVFINEGGADSVVNGLPEVESSIRSGLSALETELEAEVAFLGHNQAGAVRDLFTKVMNSISDMFKSLYSEDENSLKSQILLAKNEYGRLADELSAQLRSSGEENSRASFDESIM